MSRPFIAVYIVTNRRCGTLYIGVTNLLRRVVEHRDGVVAGFTKRYGLTRLVWFEAHASVVAAIAREKQLKHYPRDWKLNLIEAENPAWTDLFESIMSVSSGPLTDLARFDG